MESRRLGRRDVLALGGLATLTIAGLQFAPANAPAQAAVLWNHPFKFRGGITDGFGPRSCVGCSTEHKGLDYGAAGVVQGTPIYSVAAGTVVERASSDAGFGNFVRIQHADGFKSLYGHMRDPASVQLGAVLKAATQLGVVGSTGASTGAHLHLEITGPGAPSTGPYAGYLDPQPIVHNAPLAGSPGIPVTITSGSDLMKIVLINGAHFQVGARYLVRSAGPAYDQTMQMLYGGAITVNGDQFNTILTNHGIPWNVPSTLGPGGVWFNGTKVA